MLMFCHSPADSQCVCQCVCVYECLYEFVRRHSRIHSNLYTGVVVFAQAVVLVCKSLARVICCLLLLQAKLQQKRAEFKCKWLHNFEGCPDTCLSLTKPYAHRLSL